jgi:hypothetical protein
MSKDMITVLRSSMLLFAVVVFGLMAYAYHGVQTINQPRSSTASAELREAG